ncbi:MAG: hypothetical protein QXK88_05615 [Desulfurococcaceae archaeon]
MTQPNMFKCVKENQRFACDEGIATVHSDTVIELKFDSPAYVLFAHIPKETVICSGLSFQVHIWGNNKYTLWEFPKGTNYCAVFRDVFLDECVDRLFVVSSAPNACSKLAFSSCEKALLSALHRIGLPLFIAVGSFTYHELQPNILKHNSEEECQRKIKMLIMRSD